jgi:hypothetical protein
LEEAAKAYTDGVVSESVRRIERCLTLLMAYCKQCETEVGIKVKSHGTSTRGKPLTLIISNEVPNVQCAETFKLEAHSNETIVGIKKRVKDCLIGYKGNVSDLYLTTKRNQIHEEDKTLNELQITNNQILIVNAVQHLEKGQETVNRSRIRNNKGNNRPAPHDAEEKAKQIMEIYGIAQPAAYVALRRADWDIREAALQLTGSNVLLINSCN